MKWGEEGKYQDMRFLQNRWRQLPLWLAMACLTVSLVKIISVHRTEAILIGSWRLVNMSPPSATDSVALVLDGQGNATLKIRNGDVPQAPIYGVIAARYKVHYGRIDFFDEKIVKSSDEFYCDPRPWCAYFNFKDRNLISAYEPPTSPLRTSGWNIGDDIGPYETTPPVTSEWRRIP